MAEQYIWCVYRHISPSGKVYIGITSQKPELRWNEGKNYKSCTYLCCKGKRNKVLNYKWMYKNG